jgi:hypothetical protein
MITLNSSQFYVTRNLYNFLVTARKTTFTSSLWIDAVCVDQTNILERNEQVKRMGQIYSNAKEVWVWLGLDPGRPAVSIAETFDLSQYTKVPDLSERARVKIQRWLSEGNEAWLQDLRSICSRGYWNRLWIVQEFLIAKSVLLWIDNDTVRGKEFSAFIVESTNPGYKYPPWSIRKEIQTSSAWQLCKIRYGPLKISDYQGVNLWKPVLYTLERPLEEVLASHSLNECADWHDKVYGLLSLVRNSDRFPIDYSIGKIELIMAVIRFEAHIRTWLILAVAHFLMILLGIPDLELLQHSEKADENQQWKTIPLRIVKAVYKQSEAEPRQWILSNLGRDKDNTTCTVDMCRCSDCRSVPLPPLLPGDEIYRLEGLDDAVFTDNFTYIAFRPNISTISGREYLGAVSAQGLGLKFLLHSLPKLAVKYEMHEHLHRDPDHETSLLLDIDPPTLGFLIRSLVSSSRRSSLETRMVYSWGHNLKFHSRPSTHAKLTTLINSMSIVACIREQ